MKQTLSTAQVLETFLNFDVLGDRHDDAVYHGTVALVDYLEQYEEDAGVQLDLDPVAIRCEWGLYTYQQAVEDWHIDISGVSEDDRDQAILEYLSFVTFVIQSGDHLIIAEF